MSEEIAEVLYNRAKGRFLLVKSMAFPILYCNGSVDEVRRAVALVEHLRRKMRRAKRLLEIHQTCDLGVAG